MNSNNLSYVIIVASTLSACSAGGDAAPSADVLRGIERERLRALVDGNMTLADPMHSADFELINPSGQLFSKSDYLGGLQSGAFDYLMFEPVDDIRVRLYGNVAVLRYESQIQIRVGEITTTPTLHMHTDLYELHESQWQVVWSQATEVSP